jgi:hypothetical protein
MQPDSILVNINFQAEVREPQKALSPDVYGMRNFAGTPVPKHAYPC